MALFRIALVLGLLAVAATGVCLHLLPPGTISWSSLQVPSNTFSMMMHYAAAKYGHLRTTGQVGDGREASVLVHVQKTVPPGDPELVLKAIDELAWSSTFLMNVGPEKGLILDEVRRVFLRICERLKSHSSTEKFYRGDQEVVVASNC